MTMLARAGLIAVPGGELYHEVRGSGPLVLVVGSPMTSGAFGPLADLLAADHTVVTYDPHGLGRSTVTDPSLPVTPDVQAEDLARLVAHLDFGPADVFGTSGGAVAGLALASRYPDRVRVLVAHEPPLVPLLPDAPHIEAVTAGIVRAFEQDGSGAAWGRFLALVLHQGELSGPSVPAASWPPAGPEGDTVDATAQAGPSAEQQADDALFFLRMLPSITAYRPEVAALRSLSAPVLVGVGQSSGTGVAARAARALAAELGVEPTVFPGHHAGFLDDPDGFAEVLCTLFARTT